MALYLHLRITEKSVKASIESGDGRVYDSHELTSIASLTHLRRLLMKLEAEARPEQGGDVLHDFLFGTDRRTQREPTLFGGGGQEVDG